MFEFFLTRGFPRWTVKNTPTGPETGLRFVFGIKAEPATRLAAA